MCRLGITFACLAGFAGSAPADLLRPVSPDPKDLAVSPAELAHARALVRQLGGPACPGRDAAEAELARMGRFALPALVEGLNAHPNPEVRARCARLVPAAAAVDLRARIDTFLTDTGGKFDHDLPGWKHYRAVAGADAAARALFAEMIQADANLPLLAGTARPGPELGRVVGDHLTELARWAPPYRRFDPDLPAGEVGPPSVPHLATLYLADSLVRFTDRPPPPNIRRRRTPPVLTHARVQNLVRPLVQEDGQHAVPFRRLLRHWMESRTDHDELWAVTSMAEALHFREGAGAVAKMALADGFSPYRRAEAASVAARLGGKDVLPAFAKLLDNDLVVANVWVADQPVELRLQDAALALCVKLTDQEPKEYGFVVRSEASAYYYSSCVFPTDTARRAALKKWTAWEGSRKPDGEKK